LKVQSKLLAENLSFTFCKDISVPSKVLTAILSVSGRKTINVGLSQHYFWFCLTPAFRLSKIWI